jgi:hypothetical protein
VIAAHNMIIQLQKLPDSRHHRIKAPGQNAHLVPGVDIKIDLKVALLDRSHQTAQLIDGTADGQSHIYRQYDGSQNEHHKNPDDIIPDDVRLLG